ncbi:fanconi-associated nuclease 1-like [Lineus longissimus]|uniref:fanconi-associated nuclease 1-like n=1 Tax=Lineus longissimus TaxID=88925 RepID=UPI002B4CB42A
MPRKTARRKDESTKSNTDKRQTSILDLFAKKRHQKCGVTTSEKVCMGVGSNSVDSASDDDVQVISVRGSRPMGSESIYFSHNHAIMPGADIFMDGGEKSSGVSKLTLRRSTGTGTASTVVLPQNTQTTARNCTNSLHGSVSTQANDSGCSVKTDTAVGSPGEVVTGVQRSRKRKASGTNQQKRKPSFKGQISQSDCKKSKRSRCCEDVKSEENVRKYSFPPLPCSNSCVPSCSQSSIEDSGVDTMTSKQESGSAYMHKQLDSAPAIQMTSDQSASNSPGINPNPNLDLTGLKSSNLDSELIGLDGPEVTSEDTSSQLTISESPTLVGISQESQRNSRDSQEVESGRTSVESQSTIDTPQYLPYYIENFKLVIKTILEDEFFSYLFDAEDLLSTETFCSSLSDQAQKLYVRLFLRKHKWLCVRKIQYPKIALDLDPFLKELVDVGLLWDESKLEGLEVCLNLLPADELRGYAKKMHVDVTNQRMPMIVESLLKQSKQRTVGAMFGMKSDLEDTMFRRVKCLVGPCYRLRDAPCQVFLRCMMLFSLTSTAFEDDDQANSQQLYQILQVNRGLITYPTYKIQRTTKIYRSKDDLLQFQTALNIYSEILGAIESHAFDAGVNLYNQAKLLYAEHCANEELISFELSLPTFLRVYTAGSVYIRVLNQGVEVLQKVKKYAEANEVLEELLNQSLHCQHYRGHWWDRLALNLDQHLKSPDKSLDVIRKGLSDLHVRSGRRLALYQRSQKICESPSNKKLKKRQKEFKHNKVQEAPKVTIQGRLLPKSILGAHSHFVSPDSADGNSQDVTLCRVEQVAISHYKKEGYDQGIHGESSTFFVLLHLYFWDIIFMDDIPDVFYNKYQTAPLDMRTEEFYTNRKRPINKRLKWLKKASEEELLEHLEKVWSEHDGQVCATMNWERFDDLEQAKTLVRAFKGEFMSGVFKRIIRDPRHTSSGMPDLVVWNTTDNTFRLVEVKGPGDKLSTKQILWLDYFLSLGATAEVCHVVGVGARKLMHSTSRESQEM